MIEDNGALVHVRTPTFRRPAALLRCLKSLQAQTWPNWVCDVYDDDAGGSAEDVCRALGDDRVHYTKNQPQKFASKNIDQCFSLRNERNADYFCVVEDDNYLLETFFEENIRLCKQHNVHVVLRNQFVEFASGTDQARLSKFGILNALFKDGVYAPTKFRLALLMGIGASNGGLFWSREIRNGLEIEYPCTATLQEYMRTFSVAEPIYVAMTPLAVWAENAEQTTRNMGLRSSYLRRELDLKKSMQTLQRAVWRHATASDKSGFLTDPAYSASANVRARGLAKALIPYRSGGYLSLRERVELTLRGIAIRLLGRTTADFDRFVSSRLALDGPDGTQNHRPRAVSAATHTTTQRHQRAD
jgi:hypothetical protein